MITNGSQYCFENFFSLFLHKVFSQKTYLWFVIQCLLVISEEHQKKSCKSMHFLMETLITQTVLLAWAQTIGSIFFYRDSTYSCCCQPRRGLNDYGANRNIWSFISLSKKSLLIHMQQQSWWKSYGRIPLSWEKARNGNHRLMIRQRTIVIYGKCHFWSIVSRVQMGSTFLHWNSNSRVLKFWPDAVLNIPTV